MAAYKAFNGDMRDNIIRVYVPDRDNAIGYIKADYTDKEEKPIYVGYSKERSPHVVRKTPALSKGMMADSCEPLSESCGSETKD